MPGIVYSTRFCDVEAASSPVASYVVPAGYRAVLRDFAMYQAPGGSGAWAYFGKPPTIAAYIDLESGRYGQWTGRMVFNEGETIDFESNSTTVATLVACGYLLTMPS